MPAAVRIASRAAALLILALPHMAGRGMAASPVDTAGQDDRSDRIQDQEDAIDATEDATQARQTAGQAVPPAPHQFNFRVNVPSYYNSNAEIVHSGGAAVLEGDPEVELGWARGLTAAPLKFSVTLRSDTDRYANAPQADQDEASLSLKASYYDANDDQAWAPFFSYRNVTTFDATFSSWTVTRNDVAVGFDKLFNFDGDFHLLPATARSRVAAVWSLGLSSFAQRRQRTPGADSTALFVVPSATYVLSKDWTISLSASTRERWFDPMTSPATMTSRRDFNVEPILTVAYDPQFPGAPQIALQASFERCSSNLPTRSWNQWTVGPVLTTNWRF
jgi:hypothetical protein